ncbi:MAG: lysophospholipid acyltransferase family protein [Patescibacteria group bacterium]|nr:lysophospholipid acyltransferase family protein [Patescibacteria group bacterium]
MKPYFRTRFIAGSLFKRNFRLVAGLENVPKQGPFLIAANHIDYLDGIRLALAISDITGREVCFISKTNNYARWFPGSTIAINPENKAGVLAEAVEKIKSGWVIAIFPEGIRNSSPELLRGKSGLARLALTCQVPVLPIGLRGPSGRSFLHSVKLLLFKRGQVEMRVGQIMRFPPEEINDQNLERVMRAVMQEVARLSQKTYKF